MSHEWNNWDESDESDESDDEKEEKTEIQPSSTQPNHIIIPLTYNILQALLEGGMNIPVPSPSIENQHSRPSCPLPLSKRPRIRFHPEIKMDSFTLQSGEEFYFTEEDGKNILLNEIIEPHLLVRKIISSIPLGIKERLSYLAKFRYDERVEEIQNNEEKPKFDNVPTQVYSAYMREMKLRTIFRGVLARWRIYHLDKKEQEELDPITLSPPVKKVTLYDWKHKRKYVFDANSIATWIESKLLYHEYGFPMPCYPCNPWTNVEFTYYQMVSIYYQLQTYGELRWGLTTLRQHNFNKKTWELYHKSALTMKAIRTNITVLDNRDAQDMLEDFIFSKMEDMRIVITPYVVNAYRAAMRQCPYHWYLELWKGLAFQHLEAEHFGYNKQIAIQAASKALLKKQELFLKELIQKGIL